MANSTRVIEDDLFRIEVGQDVKVGKLFMPSFVEAVFYGFGEPDSRVRVELREKVPRVVEICWQAGSDDREVMPKDLRAFDFSYVIDTLYAAAVRDANSPHRAGADFDKAVREFIEERRTGRRRVDTAFLRQVAGVYRNNIDYAPTAAVARTFGVKHRQATGYVTEARKRKLLPATEQGRAKA